MKSEIRSTDKFSDRHIGPGNDEQTEMLRVIGASDIDQLINETIPKSIRLKEELAIDEAMSEYNYLRHLAKKAAKNKIYRSYIGQGYYNCIIPSVIKRNLFENPGWYTQYTPYQAEISQGRLEALLNFQTMVGDLTGLEIVNASLLDEGTAAAEAMVMFFNLKNKREVVASKFFVSSNCFPQTIDILRTRSKSFGIELVIGDHAETEIDGNYFGAVVQYPDNEGSINDYREFTEKVHSAGAYLAAACDLMSLALITPPGEWGADVAFGNTQRFGVPLGYGGPHAAYFAVEDEFKRVIPGRIIGVSIDIDENISYRMALQTREQHIRREKATSNICTAQALLAIMAGMYGIYHGRQGLVNIAERIHKMTKILNQQITQMGLELSNENYFDTLKIKTGNTTALKTLAESKEINFFYIDDEWISIAIDETTQSEDLEDIISLLSTHTGAKLSKLDLDDLYDQTKIEYPPQFSRTSDFLTHPVFNSYHTETDLMRYLKKLENRDISLVHSMIALGSCTMKLNAAVELEPVSWPQFSMLHPFVPVEQVDGYSEIIIELEADLCEITGFAACSLQPNSGAQGEYSGLMVIKAYHQANGDNNRDVVLIPSSAHGTNPASGVMAGMKVIVVECDELGNIDLNDLGEKAEQFKDSLSALMVTYPSTHGVFEETIQEVCSIVHKNGGQVYMDGANMNAQVGLTSPAMIGADVCHLNLHKTFSIPHGGGGPGMGPICVVEHLAPFLPGHPMIPTGGDKAITAISAAPWGSASILLISYAYIKLLGKRGLRESSKMAILSANYLKTRLSEHYPILYSGTNGRVAHEFIIDTRIFKHSCNVEVEDIAKRLMDYGFHAPTISFPVPGTMMVEPTESESKAELDRFIDALIAIRKEIQEIEDGIADTNDNVLKNAPHTQFMVIKDEWDHDYSREKAAFPLPHLIGNKNWPAVRRVNNSYGDRNLVCSCPPIDSYQLALEH
ncbi:MAG: aminomethyl-transferring glycine dehydrogenase [Bacteroidetes bacterium]|nr:aminomethyl-transferring glycine dehydrogenase [Bacteroidota bacterium]